jgi:hypothetical protein
MSSPLSITTGCASNIICLKKERRRAVEDRSRPLFIAARVSTTGRVIKPVMSRVPCAVFAQGAHAAKAQKRKNVAEAPAPESQVSRPMSERMVETSYV